MPQVEKWFSDLISVADLKRADALTIKKRLIIQVKDYQELVSIPVRASLLSSLCNSINEKRLDEKDIVCVGTTSIMEESLQSAVKPQYFQSDITHRNTRTILMPPNCRPEANNEFEVNDRVHIKKKKIFDILGT